MKPGDNCYKNIGGRNNSIFQLATYCEWSFKMFAKISL